METVEEEQKKRLFFGLEVSAPWPRPLPKGRILRERDRHLTLAFLGNVPFAALEQALPECPPLPYKVGCVGHFTEPLFLPKKHPKVAAWRTEILSGQQKILDYQQTLSQWLFQIHYDPLNPHRPFLPHVTLARSPLYPREWKKAFQPIPMLLTHLHLYESVGRLHYQPIWTSPVRLPVEEIPHTADIAFCIRGESLEDIYLHALTALACYFPAIYSYTERDLPKNSLEDIIISLNAAVSSADTAEGCPFKAVSFHGKLITENDTTLKWEMIVDV